MFITNATFLFNWEPTSMKKDEKREKNDFKL